MADRTMFDKIWDAHVVIEETGRPPLIYIDLHLVHEVTSPQAFEGLRIAGRKVRRPDRTFATMDHNVPTTPLSLAVLDQTSKRQMDALSDNCRQFGITLFDLGHEHQGIVHVIGPELGLTQPGMTIVCGDSHTSTHGAFGALAFGIGTSEVEHVLATQCLCQPKPMSMKMEITGRLQERVGAKDLALAIIGTIGTDGGTGYVIEYCGSAVQKLNMEGRMTLCNMSIEAGARAGMVAPDDKTYEFLEGRPYAPSGKEFDRLVQAWRQLPSFPDAPFARVVTIAADHIEPQVTWGTSPGMVVSVTGSVPDPASFPDANQQRAAERALDYMGLEPGTPIQDIKIDYVFIGSCTNARLEDLRAAARVARGRRVAHSVKALVVPGSKAVKKQAEAEGIDLVFKEAGFEWREPGCSMCLAMNPDVLAPGARCASTSNRNFEGRQGKDGRTHLVGPEMAAAAAIEGHFVDIREWDFG